MQKCEKCHTRFRWMEMYKLVWKSSRKEKTIDCRNCDTEHVLSLESQVIKMVLVFIATFITGYVVFTLEYSKLVSFFLLFFGSSLLSAILYSIAPFLFRLRSIYHANYKVLK